MWIVYNDDLEGRMGLPKEEFDVPLIFQRPPLVWIDRRSDDEKERSLSPTANFDE
jgi:hypothetical protein